MNAGFIRCRGNSALVFRAFVIGYGRNDKQLW